MIPACDTIEQVVCWKDVAWAEPVLALKKPGWFMGHWLLNVAFDQLFPVENPRDTIIAVWTDDDEYPDGFYANLEKEFEKHNRPAVMVTNMRRWMHGPTPVDMLHANAAHMRCCSVGLEQIYCRADFAQHYRFGNAYVGDGYAIEQMYKELGNHFVFLPHLVVEWNRLV